MNEENPKVEITQTSPIFEEKESEIEDYEEDKVVATACPVSTCSSTSAYMISSLKEGGQIGGAPMNKIMFRCKSCNHSWTIGY